MDVHQVWCQASGIKGQGRVGCQERPQGEIQNHLQFLKREREAVQSSKLLGETESQSLLDLRNTLQRCRKEKFVSPEAFPNDLNKRIEKFSEMNPFLNTAVKNFKDTVISGPPKQKVVRPAMYHW
ncbi:hypothetical protein lerEdw1_010951 [Lerista edwardsae]|nr:hypothetical protein lerEdw1_010951 [Lerista edwardsae]